MKPIILKESLNEYIQKTIMRHEYLIQTIDGLFVRENIEKIISYCPVKTINEAKEPIVERIDAIHLIPIAKANQSIIEWEVNFTMEEKSYKMFITYFYYTGRWENCDGIFSLNGEREIDFYSCSQLKNSILKQILKKFHFIDLAKETIPPEFSHLHLIDDNRLRTVGIANGLWAYKLGENLYIKHKDEIKRYNKTIKEKPTFDELYEGICLIDDSIDFN